MWGWEGWVVEQAPRWRPAFHREPSSSGEEMSPSDTFHWFPSLRLILPKPPLLLAHTFLSVPKWASLAAGGQAHVIRKATCIRLNSYLRVCAHFFEYAHRKCVCVVSRGCFSVFGCLLKNEWNYNESINVTQAKALTTVGMNYSFSSQQRGIWPTWDLRLLKFPHNNNLNVRESSFENANCLSDAIVRRRSAQSPSNALPRRAAITPRDTDGVARDNFSELLSQLTGFSGREQRERNK